MYAHPIRLFVCLFVDDLAELGEERVKDWHGYKLLSHSSLYQQLYWLICLWLENFLQYQKENLDRLFLDIAALQILNLSKRTSSLH